MTNNDKEIINNILHTLTKQKHKVRKMFINDLPDYTDHAQALIKCIDGAIDEIERIIK